MRLFLIVFSLFSLSACTKVAFKMEDKANAMKADVFAPVSNGDGGVIPRVPGGTTTVGVQPSPTPIVSIPGVVTPLPTPIAKEPIENPHDVGIDRHCSDNRSVEYGGNINASSTVVIKIYKAEALVCTLSDSALNKTGLNAGKISVESCNLTDGNFKMSVIADGKSMLVGTNDQFSVDSGEVINSIVKVLIDSNPFDDNSLGGLPPHMANVVCDTRASPLYVDFRKDTSDYDILSAPEDGVMFDILGANGTPQYTKSQISWFEKGHFGLLALPDSSGAVKNIDQLFGDNTKGPDGTFASNGFTALAKHDSNGDQVIDRHDAVFSKLRLWFDFNRDGKADARELKTLDQMKLVAIDLDYDKNFREVDQYGNEIKYKSVVKFKSGKLRSIFDVWFKL